METEDPRAVLGGKDVTLIAAATRDLARMGEPTDLLQLVELATTNKSTGVRLSAAAAAADILSRHRGQPGQDALPDDIASAVMDAVTKVDPGKNPAVLSVLAGLDPKKSLPRLGRMLRDPRNTVRAGAGLALRRYALPSSAFHDTLLREHAETWLADKRVPPDVKLDLIRLAGELGWTGLEFELTRAAAPGGLHAEALTQARERLDARGSLSGWAGLYRSLGHDLFAVDGDDTASEWRVVHAEGITGPDGTETFVLEDGTATAEGETWRLVWFPTRNEIPGAAVLQSITGRAFAQVRGDELIKAAHEQSASLAQAHAGAARQLAIAIEATEEEPKPPVVLAAISARLAAGDSAEVLALLEPLIDTKKPKADLFYMRAVAHHNGGDKAAARADLDTYFERAGVKSKVRESAEELLASLK